MGEPDPSAGPVLWLLLALPVWLAPINTVSALCEAPFGCACDTWGRVIAGEVISTSVRVDGWNEVEIEVTGEATDRQGVVEEPEPQVGRALAGADVAVGDRVVADYDGDGTYRVRLVADASGLYSCEGASLTEEELLALAFSPTCIAQMEQRTGRNAGPCDDLHDDTACIASVGGKPSTRSSAVVVAAVLLLGLGLSRRHWSGPSDG